MSILTESSASAGRYFDDYFVEDAELLARADAVANEQGSGSTETWDSPPPDAVDLVVETQVMISVFVARQLIRIDQLRREAHADAHTDEHADAQDHGLRLDAHVPARAGAGLAAVIDRSVRLELAAALGITEGAAGELMYQAQALVHRYPSVLDSLAGARITQRHAQILVEAMDGLDEGLRADVLPRVVALAEEQPVGTFRRHLRRLIDAVRTVTLAERHEQALTRRRVITQLEEDGMAWLMIYLPAVEAHAIHGRLTASAKVLTKVAGEQRTLDQARSDVAADILIDGVPDSLPPEARGIRPTVVVTVPVLALLEPEDTALAGDDGRSRATAAGSATVEGVGPIPIDRARQLCGEADGWMRVLTHPETGIVLSVGRDQYRPPASLRRLVRWRSGTCMAPGCGMPASRCDLDHTIAWQHGGDTADVNLAPVCRGHHIVKHHGRWKVDQIPGSGGALQWTSPTGRTYRVEPERRIPTFTPAEPDAASPF